MKREILEINNTTIVNIDGIICDGTKLKQYLIDRVVYKEQLEELQAIFKEGDF